MEARLMRTFAIGMVVAHVRCHDQEGVPTYYTVELRRCTPGHGLVMHESSILSHDDLLNGAKLLERTESYIAQVSHNKKLTSS